MTRADPNARRTSTVARHPFINAEPDDSQMLRGLRSPRCRKVTMYSDAPLSGRSYSIRPTVSEGVWE